MLPALLLAAAVVTSQAQPAKAPNWGALNHTEAVLRFSHSLGYPARLKVCKKLLPDKKGEFDAALKSWTAANREQIARGRDVLSQESGNSIAMIRANQEWLLERSKLKPVEEQRRGCGTLLDELREEAI